MLEFLQRCCHGLLTFAMLALAGTVADGLYHRATRADCAGHARGGKRTR